MMILQWAMEQDVLYSHQAPAWSQCQEHMTINPEDRLESLKKEKKNISPTGDHTF